MSPSSIGLIAPTAGVHCPADLGWAAYLVAGWWEREGAAAPAPDADPDDRAVLARLRGNGVPLLTLAGDRRPAATAHLDSAPFKVALQHDRAALARQETAFGEIAAAWKDAGIAALFVKSLGPCPSFAYNSGNLDILVPHERQDDARRIVRELGYVELRHIEEPNKFLLRWFHLGESAFDLHIHGRVEWHTEFVDEAALWSRARCAPDTDLALLPAPEDGVLIQVAHALYENKALKLVEVARVVYAARMYNLNWDTVFSGADARGWGPGLCYALALADEQARRLWGAGFLDGEIAQRVTAGVPAHLAGNAGLAGETTSPVRIGFAQSKRLFYGKMLADPSLKGWSKPREVLSHTLYGARMRLRLRSQRPMLIALDGIDGSGKSAHAALFHTALAASAIRGRVVWTRGGSSSWLQPLLGLGKRALRARPANDTHAAVGGPDEVRIAAREAERDGLFAHPVARALWPWLVAVELGLAYQWRIRLPLLRGEVVIADRYLVSALVELAARVGRPDVTRGAPGRLLRLLAPEPDRSFWFGVPAEVALARKEGRESPAFLRRQVEAAGPVVAELGAEPVEGTESLATLNNRLVTGVFRRYLDRHRTLLNWLFWSNPRRLPREWTQEPEVRL